MKIRLTPEQVEFIGNAYLKHRDVWEWHRTPNPLDLKLQWCAENPIEVGEEQVISCHCCDDGVYKHFARFIPKEDSE